VTTVFFVALAQDLGRGAAVTVGFCLSFALARLWHVFNLRMAGTGLIRNKVVCNRWIRYAIAVCLVLTAAAVWLPGLSTVLEGCRWTVRAGLWFWPAASRRFWWDRRRWPLFPAPLLTADRRGQFVSQTRPSADRKHRGCRHECQASRVLAMGL
jgi:hypothetical protein